MGRVPSLVSLCIAAANDELSRGDDIPPVLYDLPTELFDELVSQLPPLALQKLQTQMPYECQNHLEYDIDWSSNGRKRGRYCSFNETWRKLYNSRWPQNQDHPQPADWQQLYWERHLQICLDEAAAIASLPSYSGHLGDVKIPQFVLKYIGCYGPMKFSSEDYSNLSCHCQQFGSFARRLRLQGVLCVGEICHLLKNSRLQTLILRWLRFQEQVDEVCKLLSQNRETLISLELIHCKLSSTSINAICAALHNEIEQTHHIQYLSVTASFFDETDPVSLPSGLMSFLSSGRCLNSFKLSENHLGQNFAKLVFRTLLEASSAISNLDLSENNIAGWLSDFNWRSSRGIPSFSKAGSQLQTLRVLNIRGNNLHKDDVENLRHALVRIPNLEVLDIGENPIEDEGIRSLFPIFHEASERNSPIVNLNLENCELSCDGVKELLSVLSSLKRPLRTLSVADNSLGSQVAAALAKFMGSSIQVLNIGGIGLGSSGFEELRETLPEEPKIVSINISKNRGGIEAAKFLSKLLAKGSELVSVNASSNLMPVQSLNIIHSALKAAKGKLELLDLSGNNWDNREAGASLLADVQDTCRKIVILPSSSSSSAPYDHDP